MQRKPLVVLAPPRPPYIDPRLERHLARAGLSVGERHAALFAMAKAARLTGRAEFTYQEIADDSVTSRNNVIGALQKMEEAGLARHRIEGTKGRRSMWDFRRALRRLPTFKLCPHGKRIKSKSCKKCKAAQNQPTEK